MCYSKKYCSNLVLFTYLLKLYQSQGICTGVPISRLGIHHHVVDMKEKEEKKETISYLACFLKQANKKH